MMTIRDLIETSEELEPETIRINLPPDIDELDFAWVMAARALMQSQYFFEDMYQFENIVRAINRLSVDFTEIQEVSPKHIWYAIDFARRLLKTNFEFSWEVQSYIKHVFNSGAIHSFYPYGCDRLPDADSTIYEKAKIIMDPETPVDADTPTMTQAQRLAELLLYTRMMQLEELK